MGLIWPRLVLGSDQVAWINLNLRLGNILSVF